MAVGLLAATWGGSSGPSILMVLRAAGQQITTANYDMFAAVICCRHLLGCMAPLSKGTQPKSLQLAAMNLAPAVPAPTELHVPHTFEQRIRRGVPTTGAMNVALPVVAPAQLLGHRASFVRFSC